jgi:DNA-binding NarL/FixJ family response regulator
MGRTVVIVDDHAAFRSAARAMLQAAGFEVVAEAGDGASAIEAVTELRPDVVLLDVQLPDVDGFEVARQLPADGLVVVLTSSRTASAFRRRLAANPSWAFIPKSDLSEETLAAALPAG